MEDLVKRLRSFASGCRGSMWQSRDMTIALCDEAADRIEALTADNERLQARVAELEEVLQWYGENARLARLIHSEGDAGRHALVADGGGRARAALEETSDE